jgi:protein-S-isoprenylcysteine O-methyltransferase Ste14
MENEQQAPFKQRFVRQLVSALAACLVLLAIYSKVLAFKKGFWLPSVGAILLYILMFFLFVFRYPTQEASVKPKSWIFAVSGTLLPMLLTLDKGTPAFMHWISIPIELAGIVLSVIALYTLGRSFGIVAAKREIKTHGVYQAIRHPLYAGESLWFLSLVLQNLSVFNLTLFAVQSACQVRRILEEEALLQKDETYAQYLQEVPWRIIPGIF